MKNSIINRVVIVTLLLWGTLVCPAQEQIDKDPVLRALRDEADRSLQGFAMEGFEKPFYIYLKVRDINNFSIRTAWGGIQEISGKNIRMGEACILVGSYQFNNNMYASGSNVSSLQLPNEPDCYHALRIHLWRNLDRLYRANAANLKKMQTAVTQLDLSEEEKNIPHFSRETPVSCIQDLPVASPDQKKLTEVAAFCSAYFRKYPQLTDAEVNLNAGNNIERFYNTEGTCYRIVKPFGVIVVRLSARGDDNLASQHNFTITSDSTYTFPCSKELQKRLDAEMAVMLDKIKAPEVEDTYFGPVLFEEDAVLTLFSNMFQPRSLNSLWIQRVKFGEPDYYKNRVAYEVNPLERMIGKKIISRDLTLKVLDGTPVYKGISLAGYTPVDGEGVVPAKERVLIQDGVLVQMLNSRTPTRLYQHSTGTGGGPRVIQLTSNRAYDRKDLKKKLIEAAKNEDCDCAYIIRGDSPGFLYRVDLATGEEQLVRGLQLKEMNTRVLRRVLGASSEEYIKNIPLSLSTAIVPRSILLEEVELIQKKVVKDPPYLLPKPQLTE